MKTFAHVADGQVIEYPVFEEHIVNRAHPMAWYTECVYGPKPEIPPFSYLKETMRVADGKVYVTYTVETQNLTNLLSSARSRADLKSSGEEVTFAKLPTDFITRINTLIKIEVQALLDKFAAEREYSDMAALVGYKDSTVAEWSLDAVKGIMLRDQVEVALYNYMKEVAAGTKPFPTSIEEIVKELPAIAWE